MKKKLLLYQSFLLCFSFILIACPKHNVVSSHNQKEVSQLVAKMEKKKSKGEKEKKTKDKLLKVAKNKESGQR